MRKIWPYQLGRIYAYIFQIIWKYKKNFQKTIWGISKLQFFLFNYILKSSVDQFLPKKSEISEAAQILHHLTILLLHQLEQSPAILANQRCIWSNVEQLVEYLLIEQIELFYKQTNKQKSLALTFVLVVKSLNLKRGILHYQLHCSCFISFPSVHTSLFMFHLISFNPYYIVHVSFYPSVHSPSN